MGCVKSKRSDSGPQNANSTEKAEGKTRGTRGEKAYLVHSEMGSTAENSPQVNPVLLEYAQKLSEEIVARAVQQWVEVDRRYSDIPYIECQKHAQLPSSLWSDKRARRLKFSINGLPGDLVAEPQRGASSSAVYPTAIRQP
ncbi:small membrane A-kinase anchor protein [Lates japonicus]|uniref:Small membrane A-kinase anchor protein n=1 Tax=Lates japonicus TaxID=270547 RepID=A0AAD3R0H5_LATJO|nr:small membrane A-kinase anchor protein [Lates japonicus]